MLRSYLKTAWRSLFKNKTSSFINIGGLSVGMAVAMLIGLWIWDELSFNHYHANHARLAQVMDSKTFNGEITTSEDIAIPLADELRTKNGEDFENIALTFHNYTHLLATADKKIMASGVWTEPALPEMLTLKILEGKRDALKDPSSVLLAQSVAKTLFGNADAMNKTIRLDNMAEVKVAGIFEDLPVNTSFYDTKLFLSWNKALNVLGWLKDNQTKWDVHNWKLYVQLKKNADINKTTEKIKNIIQPHIREGKEEILLQPMDNLHLYSEFKNGKSAGGRIRYVRMFSIIGLFVLLLACINFMNLSTAKSAKRAKETGIRKTIGSSRQQLIWQFLSESILITLLAFSLSLAILFLSIPFFNELTDKTIAIPFSNLSFLASAFAFAIITGFIAGSYPAFYLSSFKPVTILKGIYKAGRFASLPRKSLVVVQFTVSVTLIIGTLIVFRQIQFAKSRPVGYTREGLITIQMNTPELYNAPYTILRNELLQTGAVENMAESDYPSTNAPFLVKGFDWKGKERGSVPLLGVSVVTHDFGRTIGWIVKEGRDFSRDFATDTGSLILNESAARLVGFNHPAGEIIKLDGQPHVITGIVKDMVMESPYKPVQPTIFYMQYWGNFITLRIKPGVPVREALSKIESVFKRYDPSGPFEYKFLDEEYARKFSDEERISRLATFFAALAIFISCLGLFGLASFVAEQRTKEIAIRRIAGASIFNVWKLLTKEFVILVAFSALVSTPLAYYFMHSWLQNYQYRTTLPGWIFVVAILGTFIITLLTVSFQSIHAAIANPVKSLRTE